MTADPVTPHAGQVRRWHPDTRSSSGAPIGTFTVLRRATAEESPLFGEEPHWWVQRPGWGDPSWQSERHLMERSLPHVPPAPGQLRQMPDGGPLVLLVEFRSSLIGYWVTIGPGGRQLWIDEYKLSDLSELVSA